MVLPDMTIRNEYGVADMVPYRRRDRDKDSVDLKDVPKWERHPAALELHRSGWNMDRIMSATGLGQDTISGLIAPERIQSVRGRSVAAVDAAIALYREQRDQEREAERQRVRDRERWDRGQRRRLAQRVMVNGRLIHPYAPRHGDWSIYRAYGCQCGPCSRAHTEYEVGVS